ncbi:MAG: SMC-Scp complex subunit ScpB [Kiritimatiellae bacterium]|nr:SMC-Scp complex subunit ScpB [Kiritimatiellia bacterium]
MSTEEAKIPLPRSLQEIVGALLFASEQPLTAGDLRNCVKNVAPEEGEDAEVMGVYQSCTSREIEEALHGLEKELERSGVGFKLVCSAGAYRLQTSPSCGRYVRALLKLDRPNRLSRASLETLAIVAYRQPITKAEIEQIRGVAVDTIVKTLLDLGLVRLVGRSELPGHPFLYGTTQFFLEHFGLASLGDLNGIDPTLQRSNPRERAAAYKKPEPPKTELEKAAEEAQAAEGEKTEAAAPAAPAAEPGEMEPTEMVMLDDAEEGESAAEEASAAKPSEDDDDFFIDDTPDEFDDDDDDDDDDIDDDEDVDEDDEELEDEEEGDEDEDEDEDEEDGGDDDE